jgi:transcriptional regulator GlxA family with amidase domain
MSEPIAIVFPLYPGVTQLDFTGPHQVFSRLPGAVVTTASLGARPIEADGLTFCGLADLSHVVHCDVLCVPGGYGTTEAALDPAFMREVDRLAAGAAWLTSVCTGSIILAATGRLAGKRAACHWAWRQLLEPFGAVPDPARVVRDGNVMTGGGVTAGIDMALTLVAELRGEAVAQRIQLALEYAPDPPFNAGRPETAPPEVLEAVQRLMAPRVEMRRAQAEEAAARLTPA